MDGEKLLCSPLTTTTTTTTTTTLNNRRHQKQPLNAYYSNGWNTRQDTKKKKNNNNHNEKKQKQKQSGYGGMLENASFMKWRSGDVLGVARHHPIPCVFAAALLFFMGVEYTLRMIPPSSQPFDLGFVATLPLHRVLASRPAINTLLAGLNTGFLGSGVDFPVGNVSFFLFYSGHVAASVIASLDMKRMQRWELGRVFDTLNVLQVIRLLSTRGHYTIDLVVGVGAGILFDDLAGKYEESKKIPYH
ncbi:hypothetical protein TEA_006180 [Camellia sinensis var. sinensis]|uniref:AtPDCT1/2 transmembrane domain-containing protein n=1 Tax=Camellia sinensis var. sinensis TaxID=542762 RepID=A0A4S4DXR9_CAMSN|nr:hypothetical protein TEA_006180 [Camellia sinensis var. sinensis]